MFYIVKINLGHGRMRALPFSQSPSINYEVTCNPLSSTFSRQYHQTSIQHHHLVQLGLGIQVQITLHQQYIKVCLEGLFIGVHLLLHLLLHHHHIFRYKPWPRHQYTPWRSAILLGELRNSMEGQVPFFWRSSRQLFQLWFMNWSSSMALITSRHSHSNN